MSNCQAMQNFGYSAFSSYIYDLVGGARVPLNVSVEVTTRCNLRCQHCYIPLPQRTGGNQGELSLAEYERYFGEFAEAGTLWLLLTGGEPFLRPDFLEIYDLAKQNGFITSVFTNGTLLTERHVDHFAEYKPFNIEISLYGATQETYERITGIPGSFRRAMRGIELVLLRGLPLKLKTALMTSNQHELAQMERLAESLGVKFGYDPLITAAIDRDLKPINYRLPVESIIELETHDEARSSAWRKLCQTAYDLNGKAQNMYICSAGRTGFHMDPTGKLSLCLTARWPSYDLRKGSFKEAWEMFFPEVLSRKYPQSMDCVTCELRGICNLCPGIAEVEVGDQCAVVPFFCKLTHARYEAFSTSHEV